MTNKPPVLLCLAAFLVSMTFAVSAQTPPLNRVVSEQLIGKFHPSGIPASLKISPDSKRVAYIGKVGNTFFVVVDGKEGRPYDALGASSRVFSPDSQRLAYGAQVGNKNFVVVDGKEGKPYDAINEGSPVFSPDSQRVAYGARIGNNRFKVVDEKEKKQYDGISALTFSPDSLRVAYGAKEGNKNFVVVDETEGPQYNVILSGRIRAPRIVFDRPDSFRYLVINRSEIYRVEETIRP